jgi:signal transduction histidine kinase
MLLVGGAGGFFEVDVLMLVTDTGPGLTPKELELLFQRFSQVSRE